MSEDKKCTCEFQCDYCNCNEDDSVTMKYVCDVCDSEVTSTSGKVVDIRIFSVKEVITDNANKISSSKHFGDFTISPKFNNPKTSTGFDGVTVRRIVPPTSTPSVMMLDIKNIENKTIKKVFEDCPWMTDVMIAEVYRIFDKHTDVVVNTALSSKTAVKGKMLGIDMDQTAFGLSFPLHRPTTKKCSSGWKIEIINPFATIYTGLQIYLESRISITGTDMPTIRDQVGAQLVAINDDLSRINVDSLGMFGCHHQIGLISISTQEKIIRVAIETVAGYPNGAWGNFHQRNNANSDSMWASLLNRYSNLFGQRNF